MTVVQSPHSEEHIIAKLAHVTVFAMPNGTARVVANEPGALLKLSPEAQRELFITSSNIARLLYDALDIQGTNVIIHDDAHTWAEVLGRTENDGIDLHWQPNKATPKELQDTSTKISGATWIIGKKDTANPERPLVKERKVDDLKKIEHLKEGEVIEKHADVPLDNPSLRPPGAHVKQDLGDVAEAMQSKVHRGPKDETDYRIKHLTRRR